MIQYTTSPWWMIGVFLKEGIKEKEHNLDTERIWVTEMLLALKITGGS